MRGISLWRPWPWTFVYADKMIENRREPTKVRGDVVFQSAQKFDADAVPMIQRVAAKGGFGTCSGNPSSHPAGVLVFVASIDECWTPDAFHPRHRTRLEEMLREKGRDDASVARALAWFARQEQWAFGPACWVLSNIRPMRKAIPFKGSQGWFTVPDELVAEGLAA